MSRCLALRAEQKPQIGNGQFLGASTLWDERDPRLVIAPCILKRGPAFEKWTRVCSPGFT